MSLSYITALTDEELADGIHAHLGLEALNRDLRQRLERELQRRLEERGATELPHPYMEVKLEYPSPTYDPQKLFAMGELLPEEVLFGPGYSPAHTKEVPVPASWDGRVLRTWPKRFGQEVAAALERAKLPGGPPKLRVKSREKQDANHQQG